MQQIIISGTTGVGKTLYADELQRVVSEAGYSVEVSDHHLFTSDKNFRDRFDMVNNSHAGSDFSIIVINNAEDDLQVRFSGGISHRIACVLFAGLDSSLYDHASDIGDPDDSQ